MADHHEDEHAKDNSLASKMESFILSSRWTLMPFYAGLYVVMLIYSFFYMKEIYHLLLNCRTFTKNEIMMAVLEAVDVVMIANLIKMIITGSYNSFVYKFKNNIGENVSSGMLKVKMGTSLIGVSSINMLQTFVSGHMIDWETLKKQALIHTLFLVGAVALAYIDYLHEVTKKH